MIQQTAYRLYMYTIHYIYSIHRNTGFQKKNCQQNFGGHVGRIDIWTTFGHPGYLGLFGLILFFWVTLVHKYTKIALKIQFDISIFWRLKIMFQVWTLATGRCWSTSTAAATRLVSSTALMAGGKCWHLLLEIFVAFVFVFVFECCLRKLLYRLPALPGLCSCLFPLLDIFSNFVSNFESVLRKLADSGSPWEIGKGNNFSLHN